MKAKHLLLVALIIIAWNNSLFGQCTYCPNSSNVSTSSVSGYDSHADGMYSFAAGYTAFATEHHSIAIGRAVKSIAEGSIVIGSGESDSYFLTNNQPRTLMVGFTSKYPTLFIDESPESEFNDKTGRIGIGNVTDPEFKLHLRADEGEIAAFKIEPNTWGSEQFASIILGQNQHRINGSYDDGLVFHSGSNFIFQQGRVGVGAASSPLALLHIKGSESEEARLFIEPYRFETENEMSQAGLYIGDFEHGISYSSILGLGYQTANYHVFYGGNVGIGIAEPTTLFHVEDDGGSLQYSDYNLSIYGRGNTASMSFKTSDERDWNIVNQTNSENSTLFFKYGSLDKMGISNERLWVDEQIAVCDMQGGPPYPYPDAGISVHCNGENENQKGADFSSALGGRLFFVPKLEGSGFNQMTNAGDVGIFWSNTTNWSNDDGRFIIAPHNSDSELWSGIIMKHDGNVGIGVGDPSARLDVKGRIQISGWGGDEGKSFIINNQLPDGGEVFMITSTGETFISHKLWAEEVEILADVTWSDFVFSDSYKLRSLSSLEDFIQENKHLPDVPTQEEVNENGINLGEMDALLLQKIEELTLYIIEQDKKIEELNDEIELLKND